MMSQKYHNLSNRENKLFNFLISLNEYLIANVSQRENALFNKGPSPITINFAALSG